jgi:hypothetical protein
LRSCPNSKVYPTHQAFKNEQGSVVETHEHTGDFKEW